MSGKEREELEERAKAMSEDEMRVVLQHASDRALLSEISNRLDNLTLKLSAISKVIEGA